MSLKKFLLAVFFGFLFFYLKSSVQAKTHQTVGGSQTPESTYSQCFNGSVGVNGSMPEKGSGKILFDSYTPTGAVFNNVDPYGNVRSQTTEQLIKVYAYDPSTHLVSDPGGFTSHDLPRMTFYGGKTVKYLNGQFTILYGNGKKKVYRVNNATLGGSSAANWSPDGRYLAFQGGGSGNGYAWIHGFLYIMDVRTGAVCTVVDPAEPEQPVVLDVHWLPEGGLVFSTRNAFYQTTPNLKHFQKLSVNTGGKLGNHGRFDLSPDGSLIAWTGKNNNKVSQIWISHLDGTGKIQLTHGKKGDRSPHFSPNGKEVAYVAASKRLVGVIRVVQIDGTDDHPLTGGGGKPIGLAADIEQWVPEGRIEKSSSAVLGTEPTAFPAKGYKIYKNTIDNFSLQLPKTWVWHPSKNQILAGSPNHHAAIVVTAENFTHPVSLRQYFLLILKYLKEKDQIKIYKTGKGFIKGSPTRWAVYTSTRNGKNLISTMWVIMKGLHSYAITTIARINRYKEYKKKFLHIVRSFQF
jgi:dipeptidyl aminopeptidase/acylaminoacyl peptidase